MEQRVGFLAWPTRIDTPFLPKLKTHLQGSTSRSPLSSAAKLGGRRSAFRRVFIWPTVLVVSALMAASCASSSQSSAEFLPLSSQWVTISGIVNAGGPVVGANVSFSGPSRGLGKVVVQTMEGGVFNATVPSLPNILIASANGGGMNGPSFVGTLRAVISHPTTKSQIVISPVTTLITSEYLAHRSAGLASAKARVRAFLDIPPEVSLTIGLIDLQSYFDNASFLAAASKAGGIAAYMASLVLSMANPNTVHPYPIHAPNSVLSECDLTSFPVTCPDVNLNMAKLVSADLSASNLVSANLSRSKLSGASLTFANLSGANLFGDDLTRARLSGANLTFSSLASANLTGADMVFANLTYADLAYTNFATANLTGANLTGANLTGAALDGANLTGANLTDANLSGANLTDAKLSPAKLTPSKIGGGNVIRANLTGANLTGANLLGADLSGTKLVGVDYCHTVMPDGAANSSSC